MTTPNDWTGFFDADHEYPYEEDLDLGGTWPLNLVAAVDFLRRGDRNGLAVWDALEEFSRWWAAERQRHRWRPRSRPGRSVLGRIWRATARPPAS